MSNTSKSRLAAEHNTIGVSMFSAGSVRLAIEQFQIAVRLTPAIAEYWQNLGAALLESGAADQAEKALLRSIEIDPNGQRAHFHLAQLFRSRGNYRAAAREFRAVIAIDPDSYVAEQARQMNGGWKPKITLGLSGGHNER